MPSLYETTAVVGDVSSSDFTTLYNASGLTVPNAGAGTISGNLNVGGNLTVQGTSLLIGPVTLQSTLSLPNYTFPLADGSTDQVLVTDGSGNVYWQNVSAIPGASYTINSNPAAGGANLTLLSSSGITDSVKFAGAGGITVSSPDANTITITNTTPLPAGNKGNLLYYDGSAWTASDFFEFTNNTYRPTFVNNVPTTSLAAASFLKKHSGAIADGLTSGVLFGGTNGTTVTYSSRLTSEYDSAGNPITRIQVDPVGNFAAGSTTIYSQLRVDNDLLAIYGTELRFLNAHTGAPTQDAVITVERGSSTDAKITWSETNDRWELSNGIYTPGTISTDADAIYINVDNSSVDSYLYMKGGSQYLKWNNTDVRFELSNNLQVFGDISQTGETLTLNVDNTAAASALYFNTTNYLKYNTAGPWGPAVESNNDLYLDKTTPFLTFAEQPDGVNALYGLRGRSTVDDAWFIGAGSVGDDLGYLLIATADNAGGSNSGGQIYVRQYGGESTSEAPWNGGTAPVVNELILLDNLGNTVVPNSLTVDTGTLFVDSVNNRVGVNTLTPAYTLDVNGDANVSGDIYVSGVHIDLVTPVHQGQFLQVTGESPATISNSNVVNFTNAAYRPNFQGLAGIAGRTYSGAIVSNNTAGTAFDTADGSGLLIALDSNSQALTQFGSLSATYDAGGNHQIRLATSTNNFAYLQATSISSNVLTFNAAHGLSAGQKIVFYGKSQSGLTQNTSYYVLADSLTTTQCKVSTLQGGTEATLTDGTGLVLWFQANATRVLIADSNEVKVNATALTLNAFNTGVAGSDAYITVQRGTDGTSYIKWDEATNFWQMTNALYVADAVIAENYLATNGNGLYFNNEDVGATDAHIVVKRGALADAEIKWNEAVPRWELTNDLFVPEATIGNIDINKTAGQIDTNSGYNLTLDSDGGTVIINDNLNVDSNTLYVDAANNRVGVNTATPAYSLDVQGTFGVSGDSYIGDASTDNLTINGTNVFIPNSLNVDYGTFYIDATNNRVGVKTTAPAYELDVAGDAYVSGTVRTQTVTLHNATVPAGVASFNTTSLTNINAIATVCSTTRKSVKAQITVTDTITGDVHTVEALALQKGATALLTTYAELYTAAALVTFTADVSAGSLRIRATPTGNAVNINSVRTSLD